jgi:hypothetical protein
VRVPEPPPVPNLLIRRSPSRVRSRSLAVVAAGRRHVSRPERYELVAARRTHLAPAMAPGGTPAMQRSDGLLPVASEDADPRHGELVTAFEHERLKVTPVLARGWHIGGIWLNWLRGSCNHAVGRVDVDRAASAWLTGRPVDDAPARPEQEGDQRERRHTGYRSPVDGAPATFWCCG